MSHVYTNAEVMRNKIDYAKSLEAESATENTSTTGALLEKQAELVGLRRQMRRVINRQYVKDWALDYASTNRAHPFTRVSEGFLNAIEASTKAAIRMRIDKAPSRGKTLQ